MNQSAPTSYSSSGGRGSKNKNQRKEPQRGPGVKKLEQMRKEEEELRRINNVAATFDTLREAGQKRIEADDDNNSIPYLPSYIFPLPNDINVPPPPVEYIWTTLWSPQHQNSSIPSSSRTVLLENNGANFDYSTMPSIQHHGCQNEPHVNFTNQGNYHSLPHKYWNQTPQKNQQPPISSMVNFPKGNLTFPAYTCSKEPPSNQNCSTRRVPVNPENKLRCGQKRPYPFSQDAPHANSYVRENESTSRACGAGLNYNAASLAFRQVPFSSTTSSSSEPNSSMKNFNEISLSLAPPISTSKSITTSTFPAFQTNQDPPQFFKGIEEDHIPDLQQQRLHNFFPPKEEAKSDQTKETNEDKNSNGENEERPDLDLKL